MDTEIKHKKHKVAKLAQSLLIHIRKLNILLVKTGLSSLAQPDTEQKTLGEW